MRVLEVRNVNHAYPMGLHMLRGCGIERNSRAGRVLECPEPVATVYAKPTERVLFDRHRDANPFFHFMESLWMLGGRNDVSFVTHFAKRMHTFSDDGQTLNGAYGFRWRKCYTGDQLDILVNMLRKDPETRRAVLQMWYPEDLVNQKSLDLPCNTNIYFKVRGDKIYGDAKPTLHMTVCCRSNDIIWGAYGANAVHMSMLLEYMAGRTGYAVGTYTQVSDSYHAYLDTMPKLAEDRDLYLTEGVVPRPIMDDPTTWDEDLSMFLSTRPLRESSYHNSWFWLVALPISVAWEYHKIHQYGNAQSTAQLCKATDWSLACLEWLERRKQNHERRSSVS